MTGLQVRAAMGRARAGRRLAIAVRAPDGLAGMAGGYGVGRTGRAKRQMIRILI
jgi:hypothetical protein